MKFLSKKKNEEETTITPEAEQSMKKEAQEYWDHVKQAPSNDLDQFMWGTGGVPPPPASPKVTSPTFQKKWATDEDGGTASNDDMGGKNEDCNGEIEPEEEKDKSDNILSALDSTIKDQPPPPIPDKIILEDIVWKQRSGFGKYSIGLLKHEWEQRRVVLFESGMLKYYTLPKDLEGVQYDPSHATDPDKSPWVYDPEQTPRGEMNLICSSSLAVSEHSNDGSGHIIEDNNCDEGGGGGEVVDTNTPIFGEGVKHIESSMRRLSSLVHTDKSPNVGGVKIQARERGQGGNDESSPGPTPFEIDITRKDTNEMWRFCFQSQSILIEWLSTLKNIAGNGDTEGDELLKGVAKDGVANHGFEPGDHILRWEMLPVLYPIQIHGIVLEVGKNCVIIADFGLASYDNQRAIKEEGLTTLSDDDRDDHDVIMAAWEKIKPKEKKRLNVKVMTDPKEIRKWSKVKYGEHVEKRKDKKPGFFKSLNPFSPRDSDATKATNGADDDATTESDGDEGATERNGSNNDGCKEEEVVDHRISDAVSSAISEQIEHLQEDMAKEAAEEEERQKKVPKQQKEDAKKNDEKIEGAPEWFQPGYKPRKPRAGSAPLSSLEPIQINDEGQSVFSIDHHDEHHGKSELPKSDSAKLVLARTHFILENEDLLPPYHVSCFMQGFGVNILWRCILFSSCHFIHCTFLYI